MKLLILAALISTTVSASVVKDCKYNLDPILKANGLGEIGKPAKDVRLYSNEADDAFEMYTAKKNERNKVNDILLKFAKGITTDDLPYNNDGPTLIFRLQNSSNKQRANHRAVISFTSSCKVKEIDLQLYDMTLENPYKDQLKGEVFDKGSSLDYEACQEVEVNTNSVSDVLKESKNDPEKLNLRLLKLEYCKMLTFYDDPVVEPKYKRTSTAVKK